LNPRPTPSPREIVAEALRVPPGERMIFVDSACTDPQTREQVLAMLSAHDSATMAGPSEPQSASSADLFEAVPSGGLRSGRSADDGAAAEAVGAPSRTIGHYRILSILGEGGMGVVYLAEQENPRRTVALKVIRPGMLSGRLLKRFEYESQVLGRLQHPGIAQVYEAGTAKVAIGLGGEVVEQPFFAMELVRGCSITEFVQSRALSIPERLELFCKVCEAVHHAHQKGVVHRDLKPANILVDAGGQPKVLDFGVARAAEADGVQRTLQTETGQLIGTIPYMSPEQIGGDPADVDTRSDVYTLGVILYELLSGELPHKTSDKTIPEAARMISQTEPRPLCNINRALRGDVQTIALKALEKEKTRRYQSALELADDIGRHLRDEPIRARPPSTVYQLSKFAKRNKALVSGVAGIMVVLACGIVASSVLTLRATAAESSAVAAAKTADEERAKATQEAANARSVSDFLASMLKSVDPIEGRGREVTVREVLDSAAADLTLQFKDRPPIEQVLRRTISTTYRALGQLEKAEENGRRSIELAREIYGEGSQQLMEAQREFTSTLAELSRFDEAEANGRACVVTSEQALGPDHLETVLARAELARVFIERGNAAEAEPLLRAAVDRLRELTKPDDRDQRRTLLTHMDHLGSAYTRLGKFTEAEATLRETLDERRRLLGPESAETAFTMTSLANLVQKLGRHEEALELLSKVREIRLKRLDADHPSNIITLANYAVALIGASRQKEALPLLREALERSERVMGPAHHKTLSTAGVLAYCLDDLGETDEAERMFRRNIETRNQSGLTKDPETLGMMNNVAMILMKKKDFAGAAAQFEQTIESGKSFLPPEHFYLAIFRSNYGDCLTELGRYADAERELNLALPPLKATFKNDAHPRLKQIHERLARLYEKLQKPEKAAEYRALLAG